MHSLTLILYIRVLHSLARRSIDQMKASVSPRSIPDAHNGCRRRATFAKPIL